MKLAVQKNHLGGLILYRSLNPFKKRRPSPKIYSIKHWFTKIPENEQNGEKIHKFLTKELSHDPKVIELINAYDKF